MTEKWLPIEIFDGEYEVSNIGRIRRSDSKHLLIPQVSKSGHLRVELSNQGFRKKMYVHRLVACSFIGDRSSEKLMVCHNDGNPQNNHVENLRWATASENQKDKVIHGRCRDANKTECLRGHSFIKENLTASSVRIGKRKCSSCIKARAYLRYHNPEYSEEDLQSLSDEYFNKIKGDN